MKLKKLFTLLLSALMVCGMTLAVSPGEADAAQFATPQVEAGYNFMVALKYDGTVWTWGQNTYGKRHNRL